MLETITKYDDNTFLEFARFFKRNKLHLKEFVEIRDYTIKRCKSLGYDWTQGCCGTNTLRNIDNAKGHKI
jgi:hypothetical protein